MAEHLSCWARGQALAPAGAGAGQEPSLALPDGRMAGEGSGEESGLGFQRRVSFCLIQVFLFYRSNSEPVHLISAYT